MAFNYYYGSQAEQFSFVRIPRIMLTDKAFQMLSITSKVLYGILLDRMSLSMKNNWFDEENRVYIIYQIGEIMEDLGLTKKKAMDLLQELETFGLLEKKRRGHGLPNILYVKNFMPESGSRGDQTGTSESESEPDLSEGQAEKEPSETGSDNDRIRPVNLAVRQTHSRGSENCTSDRSGQHSRSDGFGTQEVPKTAPLEVQDSAPLRNQTDNNYTYRNQTESNLILSADSLRRYDEMRFDAAPDDVVSAYQQLIRENVDYDSLVIAHSIHEIYITHQDELMCSEKTIYNYIDDCLLDVRNIDLPRKVRFRARRKKPEFKVDKGCRVGRSYKEFEAFMEKNPDTAVVQMDSVIGTIGGKCLLTIHFVESSLMLAFLRDANTSQSVLDVFEWLDRRLGGKLFNQLFSVIVTDNGSEFSNPKKIEYRDYVVEGCGFRRTSIYYCDAGCPYQKGAIEVNHELIRRVLPKGTSFDSLTQADVTRMMDHINSYKRKKLNDRSPYETFSFHYGEEVLKLLGCTPVAAEDILLKPSLLKK